MDALERIWLEADPVRDAERLPALVQQIGLARAGTPGAAARFCAAT
jgi:hypothetical protein